MNKRTDLTPFRIHIPQADLDDLNNRLAHTRWPHPVPGRGDRDDFSRGIPLTYLQELAAHWHAGFDWRAQEEQLNQYEQYTTLVDGQTFHVVHERSANPDAVPLLLIHGWPGSFAEYQRLIPLLTDEFHVVIPSPPGFAFSTPLSAPGWELARTTEAYADIMTRLGYERFAAHATDLGSGIMWRLAALHPDRVIGAHFGTEQRLLGLIGVLFPVPEGLTPGEQAQLDAMRADAASERGYLEMQNHKPDTIGPALTDSPVGQLAWIVEKFHTRHGLGTPDESVDRDQLLTNVSLYWYTRSGESSAQFYYEAAHSEVGIVMPTEVPSGWAVFDADPLVRRAMDPAGYIGHWSEFAEGGHFPAMEAPELLANDIHAFFGSVQ
ncbi:MULTISPECIES: epoxide hydrolase family protein [Microbacterium]|uniref:epoxide hydrolase family protein n=1 Tax=Microbacterium TaxID=33882 RepID=UPI000D6451DE|nr:MULTISPECIES: epoxide hydrolase family protein [Microbacterium]